MFRITMAAAAGGVLAHALGTLQEPPAPKGGLTPEQREVLSHMKVVHTDDGQGRLVPTILIEGVNVQIVNGRGSMQSTNGRGNLIVGYQSERPFHRTGSHNIVVGDEHTYTSYGGIVSGEGNWLAGPNSVALAARSSVVRGEACAVVAGLENEVDGLDNALIAGDNSLIRRDAERCTIIGSWDSDILDGDSNLILGGQGHSIGGGSFNALVTGVGHHLLFADYVGVVSGESHDLVGPAFAALLGGRGNHVGNSIYHAALVGGEDNTVSADFFGTAVGGTGNEAQGHLSTVTGGLNRTAPGEFDWVAGGLFQDQ